MLSSSDSYPPDQSNDVPGWLWRGVWTALAVAIATGSIMIVLLAAGLADPPRAGPLIWQNGPIAINIPVNYTTTAGVPIDLPHGPYTLEITAVLTGDASARWGIMLENPGDLPFDITLDGQKLFAVSPPSPDFTPFIHIRPVGNPNKLSWNVDAQSQATLRINDEIAWQGAAPTAQTAQIHAAGGKNTAAQLDIQRIALYATK